MIIPSEILTAITWLAIAGAVGIFVLVLALLLGKAMGNVIEDLMRWVR
jgi:hypothetical protein